MSYLLDSDVIIDFLKKKEPGLSLISNLVGNKFFTSIISWTEILYGIRNSVNSSHKNSEFNNFMSDFEIDILSVNQDIASQYVDLRIELEKKGKRLADFDLLIASTAIVNNLTLLSRNKRHFSRISNLRLV